MVTPLRRRVGADGAGAEGDERGAAAAAEADHALVVAGAHGAAADEGDVVEQGVGGAARQVEGKVPRADPDAADRHLLLAVTRPFSQVRAAPSPAMLTLSRMVQVRDAVSAPATCTTPPPCAATAFMARWNAAVSSCLPLPRAPYARTLTVNANGLRGRGGQRCARPQHEQQGCREDQLDRRLHDSTFEGSLRAPRHGTPGGSFEAVATTPGGLPQPERGRPPAARGASGRAPDRREVRFRVGVRRLASSAAVPPARSPSRRRASW